MKLRWVVTQAVAGLGLISAGCASVSTPRDVGSAWTPPPDARKADAVWAGLRNQKTDFSRSMTLAELTDVALRNHPASRKAWFDAAAAAAQVEQAKGYFMPSLTATVGGMRQHTQADPDTFDQDYTKFNPGLQVNYLILNFGGGRGAAVEQALQTVYALDFAFNKSIQDILLAVESAYCNVISAQAAVEAVEISAKDAKTALDVAQEMRKQKLGTDLDVMQAQAAHDQSLFNLANVKGQLKIARGGLAQAMGVPADTEILVAAPAEDLPEMLTDVDVKRLIDDALQRRPDIASLRATLAAKKAAVGVAAATMWPSLYANGSVSRDSYDFSSSDPAAKPTFPDSDVSMNVGVSLQWTLFDGFRMQSAKHIAEAQAQSAEAQLVQAELAASADVWARYRNYETAIEKHKFSLAYLKSATAAYDLALESYRAGIKGILDLLTAESQAAQARSQRIAARQEILLSLVNLAYSAGLLEKGGTAQVRNIFSTPTAKKDE